MPPIPIHKDAPIKPQGITPQTSTNDPIPANPPPTRTLPAANPNPTTTTPATYNNPPPPQPGARPTPTATNPPFSYNPNNPAQPQPGARPSYTATHITTETHIQAPPPQFSLPPPSDSQLAGRSTTTSTTSNDVKKPGPTTLSFGGANPAPSPFQTHDQGGATSERRSLEHPPGYVQSQVPDHPSYGNEGGAAAEVGGAAWNMLAKAGEALKKGEEAAWRAVGNK